ncbi:MAG: hypothetical protein II885_17590 [Oscillospiraceae bacterium]|nr:hypothetical protein [Oscillospiraceae bacterium]
MSVSNDGGALFTQWKAAEEREYGSLTVYRKEVAEELAQYEANHLLAELDEAVASAIEGAREPEALRVAWSEIQEPVKPAFPAEKRSAENGAAYAHPRDSQQLTQEEGGRLPQRGRQALSL